MLRQDDKLGEASIPVYNAVVLMGIINRPKWWTILLFIPIINLLMFPIIWVETCRSFGFNSTKDTILAIVTFGLYIYYINYTTDAEYIKERSLKPRTEVGEWVSSITFAIIAATLVHTYFMQPYTIPTSSLEKTLLVGDYLFVSKFHYGARVPMTTVAAPMVHDTLPVLGKSYLFNDNKEEAETSLINKLQLPYLRLPGFQKVKRNDIVVFSWPADTVRFFRDDSGMHFNKPIDKKSNYVKRCVGIAGDTLSIKDGYIYINGKRTVLPDRAKPQWNFNVDSNGKNLDIQTLMADYGVKEGGRKKNGNYVFNLTDNEAKRIENLPSVKSATKLLRPSGFYNQGVFPHNPKYPWSQDNYGPIYIPKKGVTIQLNENTMPFYERLIREYEGNNIEALDNDIYINGQKTNQYTFKQDYYWMMGDNRQRSEDSRYWGFVPFDHVVGKPVFIWFSWDTQTRSVRWDRLFTTVHSNGKPVSYLKYFILALIAYFGYKYFKKKRKKA